MNTRIKKVRKHFDLTQEEFGKRIGIKQNSVALIEGGRNTSDQTIFAICREFKVSESWLRTGKGEMLMPRSRSDEISAFIGDILSGSPDFKTRFVAVLAQLNSDEWELLEQMARKLAAEEEKEKADP